jgi:1-deoxy-D-xylulose-5-phosphate synthase
MSIDPNVGALKEYLTDITTTQYYNRFRDELWNLLGRFGSSAQNMGSKMETAFKAVISKSSNLFEALNFRYFGPIDGHDVVHLAKVMEDLKSIPGPKLLHCVTVKGKGYAPAEKDQTIWHAPGQFDIESGERIKAPSSVPVPPKYQDVFGKTIIELAEKNKKIMGVTPAMPSGSSLKFMMDKMPERAFDVGIAEQHAVTFSAGLSTQGYTPFCNIYSTFMQRAYDQVIHDVALQNLHVVFCMDRGGLVGDDGPTHHGVFDYAYMRCLPNMVVMSPMNEKELRDMMYTAQLKNNAGPISIRYPRGQGVMPEWETPFEEIKIGKGRIIKEGKDIAILSIGHIGNYINDILPVLAKEGIDVAHYDLRFVKPLDHGLLHDVFKKHNKVITLENGCLQGGVGSAVLEFMCDNNYKIDIKRLGIPDRYIDHGKPEDLHRECGYDKSGILQSVRSMVQENAIVS